MQLAEPLFGQGEQDAVVAGDLSECALPVEVLVAGDGVAGDEGLEREVRRDRTAGGGDPAPDGGR
ncbi:hypothetical protein NS283_02515 [Microbacterium testaceum]|nr:hypothetical protein NS283_02515 [Microbacterium testaceum]